MTTDNLMLSKTNHGLCSKYHMEINKPGVNKVVGSHSGSFISFPSVYLVPIPSDCHLDGMVSE